VTRRGPDAGQAAIVVVGATAVTAMLLLSIARFGSRLDAASRARSAADAAALAGAAEGRGRAEAMARENGATLMAFMVIDASVVVTVRVGAEEATARATSES